MSRRRVTGAALALALITSGVPALGLLSARAQSEAPAVASAYDAVARWLFDLYLNQSIRLTVANAAQTRADAPQVLGPQVPAIARVLDRHREDFVRSMAQPLRTHFGGSDITALAGRVAKPPVDLDEATRQRLIAVDADFRREGQKTIRALTFDLGSIVAEALAASRQN